KGALKNEVINRNIVRVAVGIAAIVFVGVLLYGSIATPILNPDPGNFVMRAIQIAASSVFAVSGARHIAATSKKADIETDTRLKLEPDKAAPVIWLEEFIGANVSNMRNLLPIVGGGIVAALIPGIPAINAAIGMFCAAALLAILGYKLFNWISMKAPVLTRRFEFRHFSEALNTITPCAMGIPMLGPVAQVSYVIQQQQQKDQMMVASTVDVGSIKHTTGLNELIDQVGDIFANLGTGQKAVHTEQEAAQQIQRASRQIEPARKEYVAKREADVQELTNLYNQAQENKISTVSYLKRANELLSGMMGSTRAFQRSVRAAGLPPLFARAYDKNIAADQGFVEKYEALLRDQRIANIADQEEFDPSTLSPYGAREDEIGKKVEPVLLAALDTMGIAAGGGGPPPPPEEAIVPASPPIPQAPIAAPAAQPQPVAVAQVQKKEEEIAPEFTPEKAPEFAPEKEGASGPTGETSLEGPTAPPAQPPAAPIAAQIAEAPPVKPATEDKAEELKKNWPDWLKPLPGIQELDKSKVYKGFNYPEKVLLISVEPEHWSKLIHEAYSQLRQMVYFDPSGIGAMTIKDNDGNVMIFMNGKTETARAVHELVHACQYFESSDQYDLEMFSKFVDGENGKYFGGKKREIYPLYSDIAGAFAALDYNPLHRISEFFTYFYQVIHFGTLEDISYMDPAHRPKHKDLLQKMEKFIDAVKADPDLRKVFAEYYKKLGLSLPKSFEEGPSALKVMEAPTPIAAPKGETSLEGPTAPPAQPPAAPIVAQATVTPPVGPAGEEEKKKEEETTLSSESIIEYIKDNVVSDDSLGNISDLMDVRFVQSEEEWEKVLAKYRSPKSSDTSGVPNNANSIAGIAINKGYRGAKKMELYIRSYIPEIDTKSQRRKMVSHEFVHLWQFANKTDSRSAFIALDEAITKLPDASRDKVHNRFLAAIKSLEKSGYTPSHLPCEFFAFLYEHIAFPYSKGDRLMDLFDMYERMPIKPASKKDETVDPNKPIIVTATTIVPRIDYAEIYKEFIDIITQDPACVDIVKFLTNYYNGLKVPGTFRVREDAEGQPQPGPASTIDTSGKHIAELIGVLDKEEDEDDRKTAEEELVKIGMPAIPELIDAMEYDDFTMRGHVVSAIARIAGEKAERDKAAIIRDLAKKIDTTGQYYAINAAARALGKIGQDAIPALSAFVSDGNVYIRNRAMYTLSDMGPASKGAIPALSEALKNEQSPQMKMLAAFALSKTEAREAIEPLKRALKDENIAEVVRRQIIRCLNDLLKRYPEEAAQGPQGPKGAVEDTTDALIDAVKGKKTGLQDKILAIEQLGELGGEAAVSFLLTCMDDERLAEPAEKALKKMSRPAADYMLKLATSREDMPESERVSAVNMAGEILADIKAEGYELDAFFEILKGEDSAVKINALAALKKIGDKRAIGPIVSLLDDKGVSDPVKAGAVSALGGIGDPDTVNHVENVLFYALLPEINQLLGAYSIQALANIGGNRAVDVIIQVARGSFRERQASADLRRAAVHFLKEMGTAESTKKHFETIKKALKAIVSDKDTPAEVKTDASDALKAVEKSIKEQEEKEKKRPRPMRKEERRWIPGQEAVSSLAYLPLTHPAAANPVNPAAGVTGYLSDIGMEAGKAWAHKVMDALPAREINIAPQEESDRLPYFKANPAHRKEVEVSPMVRALQEELGRMIELLRAVKEGRESVVWTDTVFLKAIENSYEFKQYNDVSEAWKQKFAGKGDTKEQVEAKARKAYRLLTEAAFNIGGLAGDRVVVKAEKEDGSFEWVRPSGLDWTIESLKGMREALTPGNFIRTYYFDNIADKGISQEDKLRYFLEHVLAYQTILNFHEIADEDFDAAVIEMAEKIDPSLGEIFRYSRNNPRIRMRSLNEYLKPRHYYVYTGVDMRLRDPDPGAKGDEYKFKFWFNFAYRIDGVIKQKVGYSKGTALLPLFVLTKKDILDVALFRLGHKEVSAGECLVFSKNIISNVRDIAANVWDDTPTDR
ncbi:MAG: HEAT repeat domain-containing protein, partial [Candidatus Omnitrophota bacterium]